MCNSVKKQYNNPERTIDFTNDRYMHSVLIPVHKIYIIYLI